jgi:hypothetical protein
MHMHKLHRHKENAAAVLLAVCVLRALSGRGFTCHNTDNRITINREVRGACHLG